MRPAEAKAAGGLVVEPLDADALGDGFLRQLLDQGWSILVARAFAGGVLVFASRGERSVRASAPTLEDVARLLEKAVVA